MKAKVSLFPPLTCMFYTTQMIMYNIIISLFKQITVIVSTSFRQYISSAAIRD